MALAAPTVDSCSERLAPHRRLPGAEPRKTFQDITHPDDLEVDVELARQVLAGDLHQMERYIHKLGNTVGSR
jgi:hypothetical protein